MVRACNPGAGALNISPLAKRRAVGKRANFEPCTRPGLRRLKLLSISLAGLALGLAGCNQQRLHPRPREFLNFMNDSVAKYPGKELDVVLDNLNTHKPKEDRWLNSHPNVHLHFIPTHSSWLNQIECWFSILSRSALRMDQGRSTPAANEKLLL